MRRERGRGSFIRNRVSEKSLKEASHSKVE
jgi:hypothetical protein